MDYLLTGILFGIALTFLGAYTKETVSHRMNHGKKILSGRREAGYVVSCRWNGSKKWFYIDEFGDMSKEYFYNKKDAIEACREAYSKNRPKQTTFARVA